MQNKKYVLFDLDGTLTDPGEGITNSVAYVLEKYGIEVPPREQLYKFIGPPLLDSFMEYYGFTPKNAQKGVVLYREYFDTKGIFENKVFPEAVACLKQLKEEGYTLVLATSKPEEAAIRILERFELAHYFDYACGADLKGIRTAKDIVIRYAMDTAGITSADTAVMVGDRRHDVEGARAHGIKCIGVSFGYGTREELEGAGAYSIANSFDEVISQIKDIL